VKRFTESAPRPSASRKEIPAWLDTIVSKTLERNPADRYTSAEDLVHALSAHTSYEPSPVATTGSGETSSNAIRSDSSQYHTRAGTSTTVRETPVGTTAGLREVEQRSIGVLAFANMSADADNEYFSDGITEEILNALTRIPSLKVASRTSSFALKGKALDISEIGRRLNVKTVLEGSVRRAGSRVRITVQLINAIDGYHIWSERYDREMQDVFEIQEEVARAIVDRLKVKLTASQDAALGRRHTENVEAYELYLHGRHCWYRWNIRGMMQKAMGYFEAALTKDPEYALAYHGLADGYSIPGLYGFLPPSLVLPKALAAATRAVELAPELAETRTSLGIIQLLGWNWSAAEATLLHAIDLNPRYALAHAFHAWLLSTVGRQREAAEAARIGYELDPLSATTNEIAALVSYHGREYDRAIRDFQRVLKRGPGSFLGLLGITLSYAAKGMYKEAIGHAERGVKRSPDVNFLRGLLGAIYAMAGERESALAVVDDLTERSRSMYVGPVFLSWIYAGLGEQDPAFEWLDKAFAERSCVLGLGIRFQLYERLSSDPRFGQCLAQLGLS
jgi:TolB-like protein